MKSKGFTLIKKILCLILVLVLCAENFAAIVSDNDGSAFITKAEFDSLKNNFQTQIDQYNTSIDAKIDSAIASYLAGITTKRVVEPDILLNKLSDGRRNFANNFTNPTTNTQDDVRLEICKTLIMGTIGNWGTMGQAENVPNGSFYALSTLSGDHSKTRKPINNGKNGKFLMINKSNHGGYLVYDSYTYSVEQKLDISGGMIKEDSYANRPLYYYLQDSSHDFTSFTTDTINVTDFKIAQVSNTAGGDKINITTPGMVSICVLEKKDAKYGIFDCISSGAVWTANTGCIPYDNLHSWTHTYSNIKLASGEAQANGEYFVWNSSTSSRQWTDRNNYTDYNTERTWVPVSFKGPKIEMIKGTDFIVEDASDVADTIMHYYSGLPLFNLSEEGKMTLVLKQEWYNPTARNDTIVAIRDEPFDNTEITSKASKDIFWKKFTTTDISSDNKITITIDAKDLNGKKGKTLFIKMKNTSTQNLAIVRPIVDSCKIEME